MGETLISDWRQRGIILRASLWAVTSLWPQKVSFSSRIYSAGAKLMLISGQATVSPSPATPSLLCPYLSAVYLYALILNVPNYENAGKENIEKE